MSVISAQPRHVIKCGSSAMSAEERVHAAMYLRRLEAILHNYREYEDREEKENNIEKSY